MIGVINYISIHAPLTGSDSPLYKCRTNSSISIHAPLTGSDLATSNGHCPTCYFNPRSPYGERPGMTIKILGPFRFQSTLPLRGATGGHIPSKSIGKDFNPRSPYGERPVVITIISTPVLFQSTLPLRGATLKKNGMAVDTQFQSTLPLRGATPSTFHSIAACPLFQSTLPLRGATSQS